MLNFQREKPRIDAGDGQRDDVNARCLQDISKTDISKIEYCSQIKLR
jgi:hypothetical protein